MSARTPALAFLGIILLTRTLSAQEPWYPSPKVNAGASLIVGEPIGEFGEFVGMGVGADFFGRLRLDSRGFLSLRGDLGFLIYGYDSERSCSGAAWCEALPRRRTTNDIAFAGIGPELALPLRKARPYVNAFMGYSYFSTSSSVQHPWDFDPEEETDLMVDSTVSWGLGGGIDLNLSRGRTPVDLNLGIRYHGNGTVEYLTERDLVDNPDGSITLYPTVSEANLMSYHFGVSIGIPGWGNDD
jgi:hypothetical protein